jgi:NTP pyrophosphatase (non-canonical NTP hydrolase)
VNDTTHDLRFENFIASFREIQQDAADINKKSWFTTPDDLVDRFSDFIFVQGRDEFKPLVEQFRNARVGLKLALAAGELSEALEAVRKNIGPDSHIPEFTAEEAEIADAILRLMNYATDRKLRLAEAIVAKNEFNRTRADHLPETRATEHGKRF